MYISYALAENPIRLVEHVEDMGITLDELKYLSVMPDSRFNQIIGRMSTSEQDLLEILAIAGSCMLDEKRTDKNYLHQRLMETSPETYQLVASLLFQVVTRDILEVFTLPVQLSQVHVSQVRTGKKFRFFSMQTYGGLDENGRIPTANSRLDHLNRKATVSILGFETLVSNGILITEEYSVRAGQPRELRYENRKYLLNGFPKGKGPYNYENESTTFYYLSVQLLYQDDQAKRQESEYKMQICSRPLNILSMDCMDEVSLWVPSQQLL